MFDWAIHFKISHESEKIPHSLENILSWRIIKIWHLEKVRCRYTMSWEKIIPLNMHIKKEKDWKLNDLTLEIREITANESQRIENKGNDKETGWNCYKKKKI